MRNIETDNAAGGVTALSLLLRHLIRDRGCSEHQSR